jgi:putative PIN family toxin of toxin-antitoxin system
MMSVRRVVFDCNTFVQALAAPDGPAGRCVQLAVDRKVDLFISAFVLEELRRVTSRPKIFAKLHLSAKRVEEFFEVIEITGILLSGFREVFSYPRDHDDAHYVNLALAADARLIVSRDADLLDLMNVAKPEAAEFQRRFPALRILDPVNFLREVAPL